MKKTLGEQIKVFSQVPQLLAYDIGATFGDGEPGRIKKTVVDRYGKYHLGAQAWEAGDVAYECLKQLYPDGITATEFTDVANEFLSMACNDIYPEVLRLAEAGILHLEPSGTDTMKEAWAEYDWAERAIFAFNFADAVIAHSGESENPFRMVLPLVLLQRLDDAVIGEILDGCGLPATMLEIGSIRDRIVPPKHLQKIIEISRIAQEELDNFKLARRRGADVIHAENRAMKAEVFQWLDAQTKFKSIESAAMAITKQQPIKHVTARDWYKDWKKLRSASTP